jgi:hypothetical protein
VTDALRAAGEEELVDPRDASSVDERIVLVWTLTRELWAFMGKEIPTWARAEMPGRLSRRARRIGDDGGGSACVSPIGTCK